MSDGGWSPPPYPYDRLSSLKEVASAHDGGMVDLSVGTPGDAAPELVVQALARATGAVGYPPSVGTAELRQEAVRWMQRRLGVTVEPTAVAACVGTKEMVASTAAILRLRSPDRDTVLSPSVAYPTYAMGAVLAGCRSVLVPVDSRWRLDLDSLGQEDVDRALCLWVNSPSNPTGAVEDLAGAAEWGRAHGVPVLSDECYAEFTWDGPPRTILEAGSDGVLAVHSLSKRSNMAGLRVGFYAGDAGLVSFLAEVRKHAGLMVPGPVQAAAAAVLADDSHVEDQRRRYRRRLERFASVLSAYTGLAVDPPTGGFYLWVRAAGGDGWAFTRELAEKGGVLVAPGDLYGDAGRGYVRMAMVASDERLALVARRLGVDDGTGSDL